MRGVLAVSGGGEGRKGAEYNNKHRIHITVSCRCILMMFFVFSSGYVGLRVCREGRWQEVSSSKLVYVCREADLYPGFSLLVTLRGSLRTTSKRWKNCCKRALFLVVVRSFGPLTALTYLLTYVLSSVYSSCPASSLMFLLTLNISFLAATGFLTVGVDDEMTMKGVFSFCILVFHSS